ncbi:MAG: hypothetical protein J7K54_04915 [Candidatus Aenigmarchaeota archaeon]|nr:hypothetical protein [Candidatus Aenigmarchaeota archaeon]
MVAMKTEIISEKDNPLMKRKEYWLMVDHAGKETPNRHDLLPAIAKKLGSKEDLTLLDKIFTERGAAQSRVKVMVYSKKDDVPAGKLARQERKVKKFLEKSAKTGKAESAEEPQPEKAEAESEPKDDAQPEKAEAATDVKEEAASRQSAEEEKPAEEAKEEAAEEKLEEKKEDSE